MTTYRSNFSRALVAPTAPIEHPLAGMFTDKELDELDAICPELAPDELTKEW